MAPPPMVNGLWLNSVDVNLNQSAGMWTTQDQDTWTSTPYDALIEATQAMSNMGVFGAMFQRRKTNGATGSDGPYCTYRDQAVFQVRSSNVSGQLVIPGPIAEIFYSDGQLVDLGNPLVRAWWDQVRAVLGDDVGSPWLEIKRGYRMMVPR